MFFCLFIKLHLILFCLDASKATDVPATDHDQLEFDPYFCEVQEANFYLFRIVGYLNVFYLVFKLKMIRIEVMQIERSETNVTYTYTIKHPKVLLTKEEEIDVPIIGYRTQHHLKEIALNASVQVEEICKGNHYLRYNQLDFERVPCRRVKADFIKMDGFETNYAFILDYTYNRSHLIIQYSSYNRMLSAFVVETDKEHFREHRLGYRVVHAALTAANENETFNLLELDDRNRIHFHRFTFEQSWRVGEWQTLPEITLPSLLSCRQTIVDFNQIKGVYFNNKTKIFYIFIDRFYLEIGDEDVVREHFQIKERYYAKSKDLKFEDPSVFRSIVYREADVKWLKTLADVIYFVFVDRVFTVRYDNQLDLQLQELHEPNMDWLKNCTGQTLRIEDDAFCFIGDYYFFVQSPSLPVRHVELAIHKVVDMFRNLDFQFDEQESLNVEFIFDYEYSTFVMVTRSSLFVIDRNMVYVDPETLEINIFKKKSSELNSKTYKLKNCLFVKCSDDETSQSEPSTSASLLDAYTYPIIWLSFAILSVLAILTTCLVQRKNLSKFDRQFFKSRFHSVFQSSFRKLLRRKLPVLIDKLKAEKKAMDKKMKMDASKKQNKKRGK